MNNIKDIVIGIFAVIGFTAIVTGFTNESNQEPAVPESHVWEAVDTEGTANESRLYIYNKTTGEVRLYENSNFQKNSQTPRGLVYHTGVALELGQTGADLKP